MANVIWLALAIAAALAVCGGLAYFLFTGRNDRRDEEEARRFFERHGHWPDEEPT